MRRIKRGILWFCCLVWLFRAAPLWAQDAQELSLYAASAVLMDGDSGRVLYEKNGKEFLANASTTKIMTCILILEGADLQDVLEVSAYAASMPQVRLSMNKGEKYLVKDLLYSLMLESHNDSAAALAEHLGKTLNPALCRKSAAQFTGQESRQALAAFADRMNRKAEEIGCEDTWFITPNGLDATETLTLENGETVTKEHGTTARDLARIMAYCIKISPKREDFLEITGTQSYSFSSLGGRSFSCVNHNAFLTMMEGAVSGKTGFTGKAGYCYVGAVEKDGKTLIVSLLACGWPSHKTYKWSDTRELMEYGLENYTYHSFAEVAYDESLLNPILVTDGQSASLDREAYAEVEIVGGQARQGLSTQGLLMREDEKIEVVRKMKSTLQAPVTSGTSVGMVYYLLDGKTYLTEQIVTTQDVGKADYEWCLRQILLRYLRQQLKK
ncbi:MAG: D-alanyl-D-alanine carboxypeptidase [Clostridium sp.]|jgi:D-alanyl-D-alanine carboxypeptidase (penicillin-binding protein 5/6)|nr:D-alanyl-D-alanine carboxypeptidase [Clostridium sp.]